MKGARMDLLLPAKIAARALRVNLMRSFLTMLGIMIGIGAVIVMVAVGSGASQQIADQIATMGSNLILVLPGTTTSGGIRAGSGSLPTLTYDDVKAMRAECPAVSLVAPSVRGSARGTSASRTASDSSQASGTAKNTSR